MCHLRSGSEDAVQECHDRHFPWCEKYKKGESCAQPLDLDTEVAKAEVEHCKVVTLKTRLSMYGAKVSGKKAELIQRLIGEMDSAPPEMGVGSMFHFNKKETTARLQKFCEDNNIMIESG